MNRPSHHIQTLRDSKTTKFTVSTVRHTFGKIQSKRGVKQEKICFWYDHVDKMFLMCNICVIFTCERILSVRFGSVQQCVSHVNMFSSGTFPHGKFLWFRWNFICIALDYFTHATCFIHMVCGKGVFLYQTHVSSAKKKKT